MATGRQRVRELVDATPEIDNRTHAERWLRDLHVVGNARKQLLPIIEDAFLFERRGGTRDIEAQTFNGFTIGVHTEETQIVQLSVRLLERPLPEFSDITWGDASRDELLTAKARLEKRRAGLDATIQRVEKAIAVIDETGVSTLREAYEQGGNI